MFIKPDFKEMFLKLTLNGQNDKAFLLTSKFCPQGVVYPFRGAIYTCGKKHKRICVKSELKEICLKMVEVIRVFC